MNRPLFILKDHDPNKVIGKAIIKDGYMNVVFSDPIPKNALFDCGYHIIESFILNGVEYLKEINVFEISCLTTG